MGIFDIFRKKKESKEEVIKKVSFNELKDFLKKEEDLLKSPEKEFFKEVGDKMASFNEKLMSCLVILKNLDVGARKVEEKVKILVKQGLDKYLESVDVLKKELSYLKKEDIQKFMLDFNKIFSEFEKKSFNPYQRATYTIGKEIAEVNNCIVGFFKEIEKLFVENKSLIDRREMILGIYVRLLELENKQNILAGLEIENEEFNKKIKELEERKKIISLDKKVVEESEEYLQNKKLIREGANLEKEIQKDILFLNSLVEWKKLANIFHSNEKDMNKIKQIKENFNEEIFGESILDLLKRAKLLERGFEEKIIKTKNKIEELKSIKTNIEQNPLENLDRELSSISSLREVLEAEKSKLDKRLIDLGQELKNLKRIFVGEVEEFGNCQLVFN